MKPTRLLALLAACGLAAATSGTPRAAEEDPTSKNNGDPLPARPALSSEALEAAAAGNIAFQAGDYEAAAMKFELMLTLEPESAVPRVNLASAEFRRGHVERAESLLREALRIDPDPVQVWISHGVAALHLSRLDTALASLARAVETDPDNARARNYLGATLAEKGWLIGAEEELRKAVKLDPMHAEAHFNLSLVYLQQSPPAIELARRHYRQALDLGAASDPLVEQQLGEE